MRQEVQVYETIKLKGLNQRFEEIDEGDLFVQKTYDTVYCAIH